MAMLRRVALSGMPLPLSGLTGKRSIVSLDNVAGAVLHALSAETPLRGPVIVADPEPATVPGMIRALREGAGQPARLFSIPEALIRAPLALIGKGDWAGRFLGSQIADPARLLASGWKPVHSRPEEGLKAWMAAEALLTRG